MRTPEASFTVGARGHACTVQTEKPCSTASKLTTKIANFVWGGRALARKADQTCAAIAGDRIHREGVCARLAFHRRANTTLVQAEGTGFAKVVGLSAGLTKGRSHRSALTFGAHGRQRAQGEGAAIGRFNLHPADTANHSQFLGANTAESWFKKALLHTHDILVCSKVVSLETHRVSHARRAQGHIRDAMAATCCGPIAMERGSAFPIRQTTFASVTNALKYTFTNVWDAPTAKRCEALIQRMEVDDRVAMIDGIRTCTRAEELPTRTSFNVEARWRTHRIKTSSAPRRLNDGGRVAPQRCRRPRLSTTCEHQESE